MAALTIAGSRLALPALVDAALTIGLIASMGPLLHRLVYRPLASASTLVLLMVSVALHLALVEMGLYFFGPGGAHTEPLVVFPMAIGGVPIQAQSLIIVATLALLIVVLSLASRKTLYGKALRAAAINPVGARLMGVSAAMAGRIAFLVAAMIGAVSGVLISAVTTITYDTGFLLGLKGFEAAVVGGLAVYPLAAIGALGIGLAESFAAFFASAYKDAIVFALIIPALLWRSFLAGGVEEDEE
jgi:branched-chain amino acid transport system permease protein